MTILNRFSGVLGHTRKYSSIIATPLYKYPYIIKRFMGEKSVVANNNAQIKLVIEKVIESNPKSYLLEKEDYGQSHDAYCTKSYIDFGINLIQKNYNSSVEDEYSNRQRKVELEILFDDLAYSHPNDKEQKIIDQRTDLNTDASIAKTRKETAPTTLEGLKAEEDVLEAETKIFVKRKLYREGEKGLAEFENEHHETFNEAKINETASSDIAKDRKHASKTSKEADEAKDQLKKIPKKEV